MDSLHRNQNEDDLNELMPMHSRSLANLAMDHVNKEGDTLHLHEYLGSEVSQVQACSKFTVHSMKAVDAFDQALNNFCLAKSLFS